LKYLSNPPDRVSTSVIWGAFLNTSSVFGERCKMSNYTKETKEVSDILNEEQPVITLSTGDTVTIYKCKVRQIGQVLHFIKFVMAEIGMDTPSDKVNADLNNTAVLMDLVINGMDKIYPVASALCSLTEDQFLDLEVEDAMDILMAEWDLNKAFFLLKIVPMLVPPQTQTSPTSKVSKKKRSIRKKRAS